MDNTDKAVLQWSKSDGFDDIDNTNDKGRTALQEAYTKTTCSRFTTCWNKAIWKW